MLWQGIFLWAVAGAIIGILMIKPEIGKEFVDFAGKMCYSLGIASVQT